MRMENECIADAILFESVREADTLILNSAFSILNFRRRFALDEDLLWDKFAGSGSIEDYLRYSANREKEDDDSRRHSP